MSPIFVATGAFVVLVLFCVLLTGAPTRITGFAAGLLILAPHTWVLGGVAGNLARVAAVVLVAWFVSTRPAAAHKTPRRVLFVPMWAGVVAYGITFLTNPSALIAAGAGAAFLLSTALLLGLSGRTEFVGFASSALQALTVVIFVSVVAYLVAPGAVISGTRLRGLFWNANTMGFFCALVLVALAAGAALGPRYVAGFSSIVGLLLSGSRASLLAALAAILIIAVFYVARGHLVRVVGAGSLAAGVGAVAVIVTDSFTSIFRTNNSRTEGGDYALRYLDLQLFGGVGYQGEEVEIASTPLRWLAQGGYVVAGVVIVSYLILLLVSFRIGKRTCAVALFGIVHSLFEGWFLAGASGMFVFYWLLLLVIGSVELTVATNNRASPRMINPRELPASL